MNNITIGKMIKDYVATFWRGNPQYETGGYYTTRNIRAKSLENAEKQAKKYTKNVLYGSMILEKVELKGGDK